MRPLMRISGQAGLLLLASCWAVQGAVTCSASDYNGTYVFVHNGALLSPLGPLPAGPFTQQGTFTSDGQGSVTIQSVVSLNGVMQAVNTQGTYEVKPDCTITFSVNLPAPLGIPATFQGVLSADNRQISVLITNPPGTSIVGTHLKQFSRFCNGTELIGSYAIDLGGTLLGTGLFHRIGVLVADGEGKFTAMTLANYAGQLTPENWSGTFVVSGDCTIKLNYTSGSGSSTKSAALSGALIDGGDTVVVMITTKGWAVTGTLKAQQP